jgi:ABC-type dipeptide/oligopeptide/nickel transport system ATPase subunit
MARTFDDRPAVREKTPVLVGLVGPSGCGKTFSALRLAAGFQRVTGGETFYIDTEARRALHYAEKFKFRHIAFGAPFSPLDYLDAIEHCVAKGATTIVIDSMSHEHEGPGGVLEMHEAEHKRLGGQESKKLLAWGKPKAARRRLINTILQLPCNFIFCFRAKQKLKIERGKDPIPLGWQPIAGEEFIYEMTLKCLLLPGAMGTPTWRSEMPGEAAMIKLPEQFRALFASSPQLTEDVGQQLAAWAAAGAPRAGGAAEDLVERYAACADPGSFDALEDERKARWSALTAAQKQALKEASKAAALRVEAASMPPAAADDDQAAGRDSDKPRAADDAA